MWCCHLAIVVPDPSHYRLTMHIPQGYMLLTRVSRCRIQRLVACSDRLVGWPSVSHPDVCPLIQHYEWWWHWRRRSFEADVAHAAQRPSRQIPQRTTSPSLPENRHRVATSNKLSFVGFLEAVLVFDPLVPVAERVVVTLVLLTHLNHAAQIILSGELRLAIRERSLYNATIIPCVAVHWLSVLVPKRDVHVLLAQHLDRIFRKW
uniref:Secreted protein n=1 Tax=Meloidogyne incognita TaxID=6306 RepID=A0A914NF99_MELIC